MMAAKTALILHDARKLLSRKGRSAYFLQILEFVYLLPTTPIREWFPSSLVHTAILQRTAEVRITPHLQGSKTKPDWAKAIKEAMDFLVFLGSSLSFKN